MIVRNLKVLICLIILTSTTLYSETLKIAFGVKNDTVLKSTDILFDEINILTEDVELEMMFVPFLRAKSQLLAGKIDGDFGRVSSLYEPYKSVVIVNYPVLRAFYHGFHRQGFNYTGIDSIRNIKLGILRGNSISDKFIIDNSLKVVFVNNSEQGFKMVSSGRLDFYITTLETYYALPASSKSEDNIVITEPLFSEGLYLFLQKKHSKYVPTLENAIKQLAESGRITEIYTYN